ncbi:nephrin isoform X3 [Cherax quadricarinatus]|uniref:nephrin isoform X3 n=1 Tax=Cherax quadricarinatus TaxID=27406 RepID=UPI00387ED194
MLDNIQECFWCVWRECCGVRVVLMTVLLFLWIPPTTTYTNSTTNGSLSLPLLSQDILARYPGQDDYISPTRVVVVAEGGVADLPCNLTSPLTSDPALLVLWYKQGIVKPIYSYDARASLAAHYRDSLYLGARVVFYAPTHAHNAHGDSQAAYGSTPAHASYLRIHGVLARDHGTYRCRVDFHTSPTLTFTTNLTVVVQPRHIAIYADGGVKVGAMAGPYAEGDTLRLTCRVTGGSPAPQVTWREGQEVEDLTSEIREGREVRNMLVVQGLSRSDLRRVFTCQAVNSNLTEPLIASTTLNLNLRPLWVRLLSSREPLSAGWLYCLVCQVVGARPPPVFTWYLGATILTSHTEQSSDDDNVTWSELRWVPRQEDDKKVLSCLAFSPALPSLTLSDDWTLDIYYLPVARLEPGRSVNLGDIKEGDDVYFVCYITSNPSIYKLFWIHEGQELHHNVSAGVIMSNQSLVLQRVSRAASGQYSCVASNIQGDGHSNPQLLRVKSDAPVCRHKQMVYLGASKYEQISLTCDLDAYPTPSHFRWTFNNSGESVDVPQEHIVAGGWRSTVTYAPNTDLDYGTLLCWGLNSVGVQRRPCVFHVFPADRPDPVHNCTVHVSMAAVNVVCMAGFDGGLPQTFILELYESSHGRLLANSTSTVPRFSVEGLEAGMALQGVVYSFNAKGRGEEVALSALTLTHLPEKHTAAVKPSPGPAPPTVGHRAHTTTVAVLVGVAAGALLVVVIVCVAVRVRGRAGVGAPAGSLAKTNPETSLKDSNLRQDENPDVIPQSASQQWY